MFGKVVLVSSLLFSLAKSTGVTFKNVTFTGYSQSIEKCKTTILHSNSLVDFLPELAFDKVEFIDQDFTVLYKDSFTSLSDLGELVLENCRIHKIESYVLDSPYHSSGKDTKIKKISLKGNKIEEIYENVFTRPSFTKIDLSFNRITVIHERAFDHLPYLEFIDLGHNNIGKWNTNWFRYTPSLRMVSMENNSLEFLPDYAFKNIDGNGRFDKYITIVLNFNKIKTTGPKAFSGLGNMYDLLLDNNQLEKIDEDLLKDVDVLHLRLNNNNIRCLDGNLDKIFTAKVTYLDSNPFDCECLNRIRKWAQKNKRSVYWSCGSCINNNTRNIFTIKNFQET
ncbi:insulin-like growth factor-binding protein complex acid labile subunit [Anoplophora glabripennis]|uniref:insulin-like growth factor-binding protein complex acid labile subunit n=1 Tax=Anoplophora glabripennis TaxID=217634 RepID=UPI000874479A|nr:insulin-like growth factor-binding protein complex acid labile subunit [Anoplophora glabripennis]